MGVYYDFLPNPNSGVYSNFDVEFVFLDIFPRDPGLLLGLP